MAVVKEQEQEKIRIPEIRDYTDGYGAAEAQYDPDGSIPDYMEGEIYDQDPAAADKDTADMKGSAAIDVDIEDMVWEVETEPADTSSDDYGDAYGEEIRDAYNMSDSYDSQNDVYDDVDTGAGEYYDGRPSMFEQVPYARKMNKHIFTWVFSVVCGMYGVDRFVRGQIGLGVLKLMTFGGFGFWYLADAGIAIYKSYMAPEALDQEDLHFDRFGKYV